MYAVAYVHCIPRQRVQIIGHVSKGEEGIFMSIESLSKVERDASVRRKSHRGGQTASQGTKLLILLRPNKIYRGRPGLALQENMESGWDE